MRDRGSKGTRLAHSTVLCNRCGQPLLRDLAATSLCGSCRLDDIEAASRRDRVGADAQPRWWTLNRAILMVAVVLILAAGGGIAWLGSSDPGATCPAAHRAMGHC